jgi:hypothetical protein
LPRPPWLRYRRAMDAIDFDTLDATIETERDFEARS